MVRHVGTFSCLLGAALFLMPLYSYAQVGLDGVENSVSVQMTPQYPAPGTTVHLTAQGGLIDLSNSKLTWSKDGTVIQAGTGLVSIDVVAPALGVATNIHLAVDAANHVSASADVVIRPVHIDLLFESDAYVPPFYRGRALPSAGTSIRALALPHFVRKDGTEVPGSQIDFEWKQNGANVASVSGVGKNAATFPSPALYGADTITVDAQSTDRAFAGESSVTIPSVETSVVLYEDNPLFGIEYYKALGAQSFITDPEMTFAAIPYFAPAVSAIDPHLLYAWSVNGSDVAPDPVHPNEITIDARKSTGQALIALTFTHAENLFVNVARSWALTFSQGAPGSLPATDAFHGATQ